MPVTAEQVTIVYKLLPLCLNTDGSASISIRKMLEHANGNLDYLSEQSYQISIADTAAVLDAEPTPGLTRRDDLSYAIYMYCVEKGYIAGIIS